MALTTVFSTVLPAHRQYIPTPFFHCIPFSFIWELITLKIILAVTRVIGLQNNIPQPLAQLGGVFFLKAGPTQYSFATHSLVNSVLNNITYQNGYNGQTEKL